MEIESIRVSLRERNPWQAIDLGFDIARKFSATIYKSYLFAMSIFVIPIVAILHNYPTWAGILIWYIKPIFEVGPQILLSRIIFGESFSNRQIINITIKALKNFWWPSLTSLRFSIRRSFIMPVFLLEGLKSKPRRKRLSTLSLGQSQGPTSLTVLLSHAEILFYFVLLFIIYQFIPEYERIDPLIIFNLDSDNLGIQWLLIFCWITAVIVVAPFYLSSGFALYLNKRIELEGWDLELSFKKIKKRLAALVSQTACVMVLLFSVSFSQNGYSQENLPDPAKHDLQEEIPIQRDTIGITIEDNTINQQTQQQIQKILKNEPLIENPEESYWRWKQDQSSDDNENNSQQSFNFLGLSFLLEVLLWGSVAALIIWLVLKIPQLKSGATKSPKTKIKREAEVFGVILEADEIDQDLKNLISQSLKINDFRKVLALLLASALGEITLQSTKRIPRGATESDCLRLAHKIPMNRDWLHWFQQLLSNWTQLAWGHKAISKDQVLQLIEDAPIAELKEPSGVQHG